LDAVVTRISHDDVALVVDGYSPVPDGIQLLFQFHSAGI
jgi:D-ribose pyranose/furanose isomerase RbsD